VWAALAASTGAPSFFSASRDTPADQLGRMGAGGPTDSMGGASGSGAAPDSWAGAAAPAAGFSTWWGGMGLSCLGEGGLKNRGEGREGSRFLSRAHFGSARSRGDLVTPTPKTNQRPPPRTSVSATHLAQPVLHLGHERPPQGRRLLRDRDQLLARLAGVARQLLVDRLDHGQRGALRGLVGLVHAAALLDHLLGRGLGDLGDHGLDLGGDGGGAVGVGLLLELRDVLEGLWGV